MNVELFEDYCDKVDKCLDVFRDDDDSLFAKSAFIYKGADIIKRIAVGFTNSGDPIGYCAILKLYGSDSACFIKVFVRKQYRGMGFAKRLFKNLIESIDGNEDLYIEYHYNGGNDISAGLSKTVGFGEFKVTCYSKLGDLKNKLSGDNSYSVRTMHYRPGMTISSIDTY